MKFIFVILGLIFSVSTASAEDKHENHDHEHLESEAHNTHDEHEEEDGDHEEHDDDHDHEKHEESNDEHEEENSSIGPDKGILEKGEKGFRLAETAIKNFGLKYQSIDSSTFSIDEAAIVKVLDNKFLFLESDGWYKKVPVKIQSHSGNKYSVVIGDKPAGARVVVDGVGFLRTAELVVEEGVAHGHSH